MKHKYSQFIAGILSILISLFTLESQAQNLPDGFKNVLVTKGLDFPTTLAFAPDGRIFVAEQGGDLRIIKDGKLLSNPFISIDVNSLGERGLLGIAFDPEFATNQYIYLYHTVPEAPIHNRISRYTANGDTVLKDSEKIILDLDPLSSATNHNGGTLNFGKDGKLYVAVGENANSANSQKLDTYLGKLLRINSDGSAPSDNPFTTGSEQKKRIWAYGFRNPFTMNIEPSTGKIFVNDVGSDGTKKREEVNEVSQMGLNFGWPNVEGYTTNPDYTGPLYAYLPTAKNDSTGCALTGGTMFSSSATNYPNQFKNKYFLLDFCEKWINYVDLSNKKRTTFATNIPGSAVNLITGPDGNLYYLSRDASSLYKITYTAPVTNVIEAGGSTSLVKAFPVPVQETLQIRINSRQDEQAQFIVYDEQSKIISSKEEFLKNGDNQISLSFEGLSPGTYYLKINYNGKTSLNKIIK